MAQIESSSIQPQELDSPEPLVRAVHDVPLVDLLDGENQDNPIKEDSVSIYAIQKAQGTEYAVVFPPLSGRELAQRLNAISLTRDNMYGINGDIGLILRHPREGLAKLHAAGLGSLWDTFYESLPLQRRVFQEILSERNNQQFRDNEAKFAESRLQAIETILSLTPSPYSSIGEVQERAIAMLEGNLAINTDFLVQFFQLTKKDIMRARKNDFSFKKLSRQMSTKIDLLDDEQLKPLVLEASRKKIQKPSFEEGESPYIGWELYDYAVSAAKPPIGTIALQRGDDYFTLPKADIIRRVDATPEGFKLFLEMRPYRFSTDVCLDEAGNIVLLGETPDELRAKIAKLCSQRFDAALAVPVVRFIETDHNIWGLAYEESGSSLPQSVKDTIMERVDGSNKSDYPFEDDWLSAMVGVDMLVAAHPSMRKIDDEWSTIWQKPRITMSEVMDKEPNPHEPTQVNGPVQVGIIALHAASRYPETFQPFFQNVKAAIA